MDRGSSGSMLFLTGDPSRLTAIQSLAAMSIIAVPSDEASTPAAACFESVLSCYLSVKDRYEVKRQQETQREANERGHSSLLDGTTTQFQAHQGITTQDHSKK